MFNDKSSPSSPGRISGRYDFGFGLKGVFKSVEKMAECPSSLAFTTDDIGHEMCHGLTLGRSTDTSSSTHFFAHPCPEVVLFWLFAPARVCPGL